MNKLYRILSLLLIIPLLSGCWDRVEMNDVSFFMASALDLTEDGQLKTSILVPIPVAAGGDNGKVSPSGTLGKTYFVVSAKGSNIHDAERSIQQKISRRFFKGHRRVVFIGEALARKGIKDILDYYSRDPGSRLRTYIVVTKGKEAIEFLKNDHPIERIPSEEVRELERSGVGVSATFRDFLMMQARDGIEPVTGAVELVSPTGTVKEEEKYSLYQLSSTAVFKKYKLKGYLNDIETRSLRWIKEEVKQEIISGSIAGSGGNVGVVMNKMSSTIQTTMNGEKARIRIVLKGTGVLNEANVKLDLNQSGSLILIEDELGKLVADQTLRTIRKAQTEWKADIFGFGLQLHLFHYRTWQKIRPKWDAIFSDADVTVTAQISLRRAGIITNSLSENGVGES